MELNINQRRKCRLFWSVLIVLVLGFAGISCNASESESQYSKAKSKYRAQDYENALAEVNEAIELDSTNSSYYELRGMILYELQDTIHSKEDFQRALSFTKSDSTLDKKIRRLIDWDLAHHRIEDARALLQKEVDLFRHDSIKHVEIMEYAASKYLEIGDTQETIGLYKELGDDYPNVARFRNQKGILHVLLGENRKAIQEFAEAVDLDPNNDTYLYNLGVSYLNTRNKKHAKIYFEKSKDLGNADACKEYRELTARTRYYQQSRCCDGTVSSSMGRGTCSHHGGVCGIENVPYKEYTVQCN